MCIQYYQITLLNTIHYYVPTVYYCYHCLLVPADLTLTTDRLTELFQSVEDPDPLPPGYLRPAGGYDIGGFLGLPESALAEIRKRYQSKDKCKEAYLDTYIHYHPCPSWKVIHDLLGKCFLDQQAEEVEVTYVQGMHALYRACTQCSYIVHVHVSQGRGRCVKHGLLEEGGDSHFLCKLWKLKIYLHVTCMHSYIYKYIYMYYVTVHA